MIKQNFHASANQVDYFDNNTLSTPFHRDVEILPSAHRVELIDTNPTVASGSLVKAVIEMETGAADVATAGAANAMTWTRVANEFLLDASRTYKVAATGIAIGATSIVVTAAVDLPTSLVGAPIRLLFNDTDANAKFLPDMLFVSSVSGKAATIMLDKITGTSSASTGAIGFQVLGDSHIKKNIPVSYTSVKKVGGGLEYSFKGSFPFSVAAFSTLAIRSNSPAVKKKLQGKEESIRFGIISTDANAGTITVLDDNGYLQDWATDGSVQNGEIDKVPGFGQEWAGEQAYNQGGGRTLIALTGFAADATIKMVQHLRG